MQLLSLQVEKEKGFGNFRFNDSLLGDHVPSMFENGERHKQQKSFLIAVSQNMLRMGRLIPNIMDIMPEHLIKWNFKEGKWVEHVHPWLFSTLWLNKNYPLFVCLFFYKRWYQNITLNLCSKKYRKRNTIKCAFPKKDHHSTTMASLCRRFML